MIFNRYSKYIPVLIPFLLISCGPYSFSGSSVPGHIKSVAIPLFEDETAEFGIKEKVTDALLDNFIKENILRIADKKNADSILQGTITRVSDTPYTFDENEDVQEFRVSISINILWYDQIKNVDLFEGGIVGWGVYSASSPEDRADGLDQAVERLVTEIINQTLSGW